MFSGTASFSKVAEERGHSIFTVDSDPGHNSTVTADLRYCITSGLPQEPTFLWASPPCTGFSVASIGKHWNTDRSPKTDTARLGIELFLITIRIIRETRPTYWIIENPRGMARTLPFLKQFRRVTVTYCQYGDLRMKPTDLWTNIPESVWIPRPTCKNGDPCHVSAPRGSRTGTQGIKGAKNRSVVPPDLITEILERIEADIE